jgi:hypothetical protein
MPLYLLASLSASKLTFVCLRGLILVVEGQVRVWLTSSSPILLTIRGPLEPDEIKPNFIYREAN